MACIPLSLPRLVQPSVSMDVFIGTTEYDHNDNAINTIDTIEIPIAVFGD